SSKDIKVFWQDLMSFYRDMLVMKTAGDATRYLDLTDSETAQLKTAASYFTKETILSHCKQLENALFAIQKSNEIKRTVAEMTLVKMCDEMLDASNETLLSRISKLEEAMVLGTPVVREVPRAEEKKPLEAAKPIDIKPTVTEAKKPEGQRVMKPIPCWMEVIERVSQSGGNADSYLKQARAYMAENGEITVYVTDDFTMLMVDTPKVRAALRASLAICLGREVAEKQLHIEFSKKPLPEEEDAYIIDEILKKAEQ
ncbi:MAG: hypothetical protein J6B12_04855, partial [Clostridia bacterium]|nr:hypothetical protein [Clostridia bacterium]